MDRKLVRMVGALLASALALAGVGGAYASDDIGYERAAQIALQRVPGEVQEIERDSELGKDVYEVTIRSAQRTTFEVTLDAHDGTVLEVEQDD
jgi:uncharacterized membrane protein YkoI